MEYSELENLLIAPVSQPKIQEDATLPIQRSKVYTDSASAAASAIASVHTEKLDIQTLVDSITRETNKSLQGDVSGIESLLVAQSQVLNVLFNRLILRASSTTNQTSMHNDYLIALKAQNQCRQTLAVLTDLKNPKRSLFVNQQNVAMNQQVNNENQDSKNFSENLNENLKRTIKEN